MNVWISVDLGPLRTGASARAVAIFLRVCVLRVCVFGGGGGTRWPSELWRFRSADEQRCSPQLPGLAPSHTSAHPQLHERSIHLYLGGEHGGEPQFKPLAPTWGPSFLFYLLLYRFFSFNSPQIWRLFGQIKEVLEVPEAASGLTAVV